MERIIELMSIVNTKDKEISDFNKSRFTYQVNADYELINAIRNKEELNKELQNRFVSYLEELVSELLN
jgi:hypothetical protein